MGLVVVATALALLGGTRSQTGLYGTVYSVRASRSGRALGRVRPAVVTVAAGRVARQGLAIETGLR
jgi:hypothetical protein